MGRRSWLRDISASRRLLPNVRGRSEKQRGDSRRCSSIWTLKVMEKSHEDISGIKKGARSTGDSKEVKLT